MLKKAYNFIKSNRLLTGILLIGIVLRLIFFFRAYETLPASTDEVIYGLLAKHILDGEFHAVNLWPTYQGIPESYFLTLPIYFFGMITFSVRVYLLLAGILFIFVTFKLADEIYNRSIALISLSLVSIPAVYLPVSMTVLHNYLETILFGSLALLLLYRIIYKPITEEQRTRYYILLGLISGLGFWAHIMFIEYLAIILFFFFIQDKLFFLRRRFWMFLFFFFLGSLPLILYNITHHFDTFLMAKGIGFKRTMLNILMSIKEVLPVLLGIRLPIYGDNWNTLSLPKYWGNILVAIYSVALLYIVISRWRNIVGFFTLSSRKAGPTEMFLAFIFIGIVVFARSERANNWAVRYLLPLFSVIPILLSVAIYNIGKSYKVLAGTMLGIVMVIQLYGNGRVYAEWGLPEVVDKVLDLPDDRPLIAFLDSKGITKAYAHYWISYRLTYETGERIICAQPLDERFGGRYKLWYTDEVASSKNVAYILYERLGVSPLYFEESIKKIGGSYMKEIIGPFTVFYQFRSPYTEIPKGGWIVTSNYNAGDTALAIDGDIRTRWGSGHPRVRGMNFEIEIPRPYLLRKVEIKLGRFTTDYPDTIGLEVSEDGLRWKRVDFMTHMEDILRWDNGQPRFFLEKDDVILFHLVEPVMARFIRLTQTGSHPAFDWSIPEISLYSPAGGLET